MKDMNKDCTNLINDLALTVIGLAEEVQGYEVGTFTMGQIWDILDTIKVTANYLIEGVDQAQK